MRHAAVPERLSDRRVTDVAYERDVEPRLLLSDFIRQDLRLTGTHVGCEHGVCGACTILFDGEPARSCIMLAVQADGHEIQTVEGLAPAGGALNPLQDGVSRTRTPCSAASARPGFLMTLTAFLRDTPAPDRAEIRDALSANLCRCTGYHHIVEAVRRACTPRRYLNARVLRNEDARLLTGRAPLRGRRAAAGDAARGVRAQRLRARAA